jgi:GNAT superfamily N-acetyltransferase
VYFKELDLEKLNKASQFLLKYIDFKSFSKVKTDVKTFECQIEEAFWVQNNDTLEFHIKANRFLRGMVRAIVGTLLNVGKGKISVGDFENIILEKDRTKAGIAAKAEGLTLEEVNYPRGYYQREIEICEAEMHEMNIVKELFIKYQAHLGISLCFQGFQEELDNLPGKYSAPTGIILLAKEGENVAGIVALKQLEDGVCEMKRLFVLPDYQGYGIGKLLTKKLLNKAKDLKFKTMKLDTLARLESAVALYQQLGFEQTEPYNINPEEDILYFEKQL